MNWENIAGHKKLKNLLKESIVEGRVSHAQLFVGKEGYGTMPLVLAYAADILAQENPQAYLRVEHLNHLDLHFSFPVYSEKNVSLSKRYFDPFREMILKDPYASYSDWASLLESENRQLFISAQEIDEQNKKFALKSFEGGTKILIIWRADKMNVEASNKFLKFLEEPPKKTIILMTAESINDILPTILSRVQVVEVPRVKDKDVYNYLYEKVLKDNEKLIEITQQAQGDINEAVKIAKADQKHVEFEKLFVQWVREAFMVKKRPEYLRNIISWAKDVSSWNREKQKAFLDYCSDIFRLALLQNYQSEELVYKRINASGFNWEGFSRFISGANIIEILEEISQADYHLTRNGNPKIIWTDLGIKLSRYIHKN